MKATKHEGQAFEIKDGESWKAQELGVNSNIPLVDEAYGPARIVREFKYNLNPDLLKKIKNKEVLNPTNQELFNAHLKEIEITIWKDGLVFDTDHQPHMTRGKKGYRIIVACKPRPGIMVKEQPMTLQEITKPANA